MKYDMSVVLRELISLRNFLNNEPFEYSGFHFNLRKTAGLVGHMIDRVKEAIECDGDIKGEVNLNAYRIVNDAKNVERQGDL